MSTGVPQKKTPRKGGQKDSTVKDPDRASLPSKLPKTISVSFLHFTNILLLLVGDWQHTINRLLISYY